MIELTSIRKVKSIAVLFAISLGFVICLAQESKAEDVSVNATLGDDTTEAGQPVDLDLEITGAKSAQIPVNIDAKGLSIRCTSKHNRTQIINGTITSSLGCTYTVQADQAGKFTIPAITVNVNGTNYTTKPLTLTVTAGSGGGGSSGAAGAPGAGADNKLYFAELVVPKQTAYVGEAIPMELRIYFDQSVRARMSDAPDIKCEGFTIEKLGQPRQEQIEKNGKIYSVLNFKTAITPVKSGKLTLGPAEAPFEAQMPAQRQPRRDPAGFDDPFDNDLFSQMMGFSPVQAITVKGEAINFEVKPLPSAGQPANFSGAVGQFSLATDAAPLKVNVGDPITLKLKISGRGNFDRVTAPVMIDENGWRSYPASGKFTADDDVGISGTKAFEMAVIPNEKKTTLPAVEFSYFDPLSEKYVTLHGDRLPITVLGEAPPVAQATPAASQASATPLPGKRTSDIQYLMTGPAHWGASFTPLFRQRIFWTAQGVPALALLAFVGIQAGRKKARDVQARQQAARRREQQELMKVLQRVDTDQAAFYEAAIRYIQIAAARVLRQTPESIGPEEAIASRRLDEATSDGVESIFNTHGELRYAGVSPVGGKLPEARRRDVLETLRKFQDANE